MKLFQVAKATQVAIAISDSYQHNSEPGPLNPHKQKYQNYIGILSLSI